MQTATATAFPLQWPDGWLRCKRRRQAAYRVALKKARDDLVRELRLLGAKSIVISTNAPPRADGTPAAGAPQSPRGDPGVAVYFYRGDEQQVVACDRWNRLTDNLRACGLTIAALRMIERTGASELLDRAFTGFKALPADAGLPSAPWRDVLGLHHAADSLSDARKAYRDLSRKYHPDHGGDAGAMATINRAWEQAKEALG